MPSPPRPAYVLGDIPPVVRKGISDAAAKANMSLADTIRAALCAHYQLDCPPIGRGYEGARDGGATRMVLRVEPVLFEKIKQAARKGDTSMRVVILNVLGQKFGKELA